VPKKMFLHIEYLETGSKAKAENLNRYRVKTKA
jgi:hypothetical protein